MVNALLAVKAFMLTLSCMNIAIKISKIMGLILKAMVHQCARIYIQSLNAPTDI